MYSFKVGDRLLIKKDPQIWHSHFFRIVNTSYEDYCPTGKTSLLRYPAYGIVNLVDEDALDVIINNRHFGFSMEHLIKVSQKIHPSIINDV